MSTHDENDPEIKKEDDDDDFEWERCDGCDKWLLPGNGYSYEGRCYNCYYGL
jgi:hypothetical protein